MKTSDTINKENLVSLADYKKKKHTDNSTDDQEGVADRIGFFGHS